MRITLACASLAVATITTAASAERTKGLSLEQIRGVMRAHAAAFDTCLRTAARTGKPLHGPFLYQIDVDKGGKVTGVRPFQPSPVPAFDKCITGVLKRARFPGGPASVEAPLVFDPR
jgi:outer membrane biosynthesis protein TonB